LSGDSDALPSWTVFFVSCTAPLPSPFIAHTSPSAPDPSSGVGWRWNAIFRPSLERSKLETE
jgi:hypothetical protein